MREPRGSSSRAGKPLPNGARHGAVERYLSPTDAYPRAMLPARRIRLSQAATGASACPERLADRYASDRDRYAGGARVRREPIRHDACLVSIS